MGKDFCPRLSRRLWGGKKYPKLACVGGYSEGVKGVLQLTAYNTELR